MAAHDFYTDYHECHSAAQTHANELNVLVRLRRVTEYGKKGFRFNLVPTIKQFGEDLKGELVTPVEKRT